MTPPPPGEQRAQPDPEGAAGAGPALDRLSSRLQRLEQQIRAFKELHVREVSDLAQRLHVIAQLQADELQLILDQLADIAGELAAQQRTQGERGSGAAGPSSTDPVPPGDPAANSPKRARWLAEQARRARADPVSRRELLFGREEDPSS